MEYLFSLSNVLPSHRLGQKMHIILFDKRFQTHHFVIDHAKELKQRTLLRSLVFFDIKVLI